MRQPRVAVRVQHHPARRHLIPTLLERLAPLPVEVIEHASEPPSPWAGYQACLRDPPACTHLLVVQDDAFPCENFAVAVQQVAISNPDVPVCLFFPPYGREKKQALYAAKNNQRYITLMTSSQSFLPVVATLWPVHKTVEFLDWATANPQLPGQREPRSDDAMAGRWKVMTKQTVKCTIPSLVEHLGDEPSVCGNGRKGMRFAMFVAEDATAYNW